jgi:hypothetical protein
MGVVSTCALSFMSKYLHQYWGPKPMTRVDINENNQSSNIHNYEELVFGIRYAQRDSEME